MPETAKYYVYIETHSKMTKLYWSSLLKAWVETRAEANPVSMGYIERTFPIDRESFGVQFERVET